MSLRHSTMERQPCSPKLRPDERDKFAPRELLSEEQAEQLASKIVSVGSDYEVAKFEARHGELGAADYEGGAAMPAEAVANKLIKEAARETMRTEGKHQAGQTFPGGQAAQLERVRAAKDDPQAPMYAVREKMAASEERILHPHEFVGPNPERGEEGLSKKRHMRDAGTAITGEGKHDTDSILQH
eukprot:scaffold2.g7268.t1